MDDPIIQWIRQEGGMVHDSLAIRELYPGNRSVYAVNDIPVGERLFSIPDQCCFTGLVKNYSVLLNHSLYDSMDFINRPCTMVQLRYLFLLCYEYSLGERSYFRLWFRGVPIYDQMKNHPFYRLNDRKVESLCHFHSKYGAKLKLILQEIRSYHREIVRLNNKYDLINENETPITEDLISWLYILTVSRRWSMNNTDYIIPFADMLQSSNHTRMILESQQINENDKSMGFKSHSMWSKEAYQKNDEVSHRYCFKMLDPTYTWFFYGYVHSEAVDENNNTLTYPITHFKFDNMLPYWKYYHENRKFDTNLFGKQNNCQLLITHKDDINIFLSVFRVNQFNHEDYLIIRDRILNNSNTELGIKEQENLWWSMIEEYAQNKILTLSNEIRAVSAFFRLLKQELENLQCMNQEYEPDEDVINPDLVKSLKKVNLKQINIIESMINKVKKYYMSLVIDLTD